MARPPTIERYSAPTRLEDAVRLIADGEATLFAGGTDLMPQTRSGVREFGAHLVNISRVPELRGIGFEGGTVRIGALTTVTEILEEQSLRECAPVLVETADRFASGQLRNTATLGGNICNASPAGDLIIPLLVLEAWVDLSSWTSGSLTERTLRLDEFFIGPRQTRLAPNEILTGFRFSAPPADFVAGFEKFGTRPALDIAVVSLGLGGRRSNGVLRNVRVAFGAVAPIPLRGLETEAVIEGRPLDDRLLDEAANAAALEIAPISDVRASAWYRTELIRTLMQRLVRDVHQAGD
jgi:CO/xanthine dehydrogenase FAD-binding subunit